MQIQIRTDAIMNYAELHFDKSVDLSSLVLKATQVAEESGFQVKVEQDGRIAGIILDKKYGLISIQAHMTYIVDESNFKIEYYPKMNLLSLLFWKSRARSLLSRIGQSC